MSNFHLTRRAFMDIEDIYETSVKHWGENVARQYIGDLYQSFKQIANNPELGELRKARSEPFFMSPARKHFVIYEKYKKDIIVVTVLHKVRDIESITRELGSSFTEEIRQLRKSLAE